MTHHSAPSRLDESRTISAPTGTSLNAKSWLTEPGCGVDFTCLGSNVVVFPRELLTA